MLGTPVLVSHLLAIYCILFYVSAQQGFLTLDCGGTAPYIDDKGVSWTPDDAYITTGISSSISTAALNSTLTTKYRQRLRYFPDATRKHCYALPAGFNETYIIRARFDYGNYNGLGSTLIEFDILIEATNFLTVSFSGDGEWYYEFVVKSTNKTVNFCLATSSTSALATAPFISAIEMRLLQSWMYGLTNSTQALIMYRRINLGARSTDDIRYPDDKYDRVWRSDKVFTGMRNYTSVGTTSVVSPGTTPDQPPSAVMSTAITSNSTIIFEFPVTISFNAYFNFYFAEFTALGADTREFNALLKNGSSQQTPPLLDIPINIEKLAGKPLLSLELYANEAVYLSSPTFNFVPTNISTLGPQVNAAELYLAKSNLNLGTELSDKVAVTSIVSHFNISGWSGDPCLPLPYTWSWIGCDINGPVAKITVINLSNYQLHGTIPQAITALKHLTKIFLENNNLEGAIPDLTSLKNLTVLHLENNKLNGVIPSSLLDMPNLEDLSIQNNSFDCVPQKLATAFNGSISVCASKHSSSTGKIIGGAVAGVVVLLLVMLLVFYLCRTRKSSKSEELKEVDKKPDLSVARSFSYDEIVQATNSFRIVLGEGSFGPVYYGCLANGVAAAVKVLAVRSQQGEREFNTEVEVLSVVHHKNLVSFLGSCKDGPKLMLIYEYMPNGTLRDHLYGGKNPTLSWKSRLEVLLDAAQGLDYLHSSCNQHIIHRDVKTTNILLDSTMTAKVADFGLSKLYDKNNATHVSTEVKGTRGYLCPDFGVVIFEAVCGREPVCLLLPEEEEVLTRWAINELNKGALARVIDPTLSTYNEQAAWKVVEIAMQCVEHDSALRPSMSTVVNEIREAINFEENGESFTRFTVAR